MDQDRLGQGSDGSAVSDEGRPTFTAFVGPRRLASGALRDVALAVKALEDARLLLLGGEPMDGPRFIWWNFVSSSKERIEDAKADWKAGRFAAVPGEHELIPLPDR